MDTTLQNLNKLLKDMSLDPEKQHQEVINEVCLKRKNLGKPEKLKHLAMRVIISNGGLYLSRVANPFGVLPNTLVQEFLKFIMNEQKRVLGSTLIPIGLQEQFTILLLNENLTIFDDSILPKNSDQPNVAFFEHAVQNCPKVSFFAARDGGYDNWKTLLGLDNYLYSEVPLDILKLQNLRTLRLTTSVCTEEFIQQLGQQIPRLDWLEIVLLKSKLSAKAPEYFSKMLCLRGLVISTRGYGESVDIELLVQIVGSIPNIEVLSLAECPVSDNDNWMLKGILQIFFLEEFGRLYPNKQLLMISVFVPNFQQVTWPQNVIVEEFGIEGDVTADEILKVLLAMPRPPIRMVFSDVPFCSVYGALEKFGPHLQSVTIDQGVESSMGLDVQLGKLNLINIIELCPNLEGLILSDPGVQMEKISLNDARLLNLPLDTFKKWKMFDLNECCHSLPIFDELSVNDLLFKKYILGSDPKHTRLFHLWTFGRMQVIAEALKESSVCLSKLESIHIALHKLSMVEPALKIAHSLILRSPYLNEISLQCLEGVQSSVLKDKNYEWFFQFATAVNVCII